MDRRRLLVFAAPLLALGLVAGACGDDEPGDAVPSPEATTFTEGEFEDIPLPPRADPIADVTESDDGVLTGSWEVRGSTPEQVLGFYETELQANGWTVNSGPLEQAQGVWRGDWTREGQLVEVVADRVTGLNEDPEDGSEQPTQLNLLLHPDTDAPPVNDPDDPMPPEPDQAD